MNLEIKLKEAIVKRLLLSEEKRKEKYIIYNGESFTREQFADEIQNETEIGIDMMVTVMNMAVNLLNKENDTGTQE